MAISLDLNDLGRGGEPFSIARGTDDTDIALRIGLRNPSHSSYSAATVTVNAATSLVITITGHASSPFTYAFATYTTLGDLYDAIVTDATVGPLVWVRRVAGLRAWLTADLAALSATSIRTNAGTSVLWDTSDLDRRAVAIGREEDSTQNYGACRTSKGTLTRDLDGDEQLNEAKTASHSRPLLLVAEVTGTFNASAQSFDIVECSQDPGVADVTRFSKTFTGTGSAQTVTLDDSPELAAGLMPKKDGNYLVVWCGDGSNNITSSTLTASGVLFS